MVLGQVEAGNPGWGWGLETTAITSRKKQITALDMLHVMFITSYEMTMVMQS